MKTRWFIFCLALVLASPIVAAGENVFECTTDEQLAVQLTVYSSNLGLVKDIRKVELPVGQAELRFMDIASHIIPVTVHARSLNHPEDFAILEQTYHYDLMSADKLLDKYVGEKIKIIIWNEFQDRKEVVEATLLSNEQGQIYEIKDEIYLGHPGYKVLPGIPEDFTAKPTLMWLYDNRTKEAHKLEVSYLTSNMNWKADYVVILQEDDRSLDISGWVTLANESGATYKNAGLKLVAGEVHRVTERFGERSYMMKAVPEAQAPSFEERAFFEYHLYDLKRKTTIKDKETKQISLLEALGVETEKELLVYGTRSYFTRPYTEEIPKQPVNVYIKFKNSEDEDLGMPLPAGIMHLYKKDDEGSLQFIGEDRIEHTPKDEEIKLKVGEAFDVVAERIQTDYKKITTRVHESEWEIALRNRKETDITVGIVELLLGNWQIISSSHPYEKVDAFTIRFDVNVPKGEEIKVNYRVRVGL